MDPSKAHTPSMPPKMKAWIIIRAGAPSNALQLNADAPTPHPPSGGDITVKVSHAALNPADLVLMSHIPTFLPFRRKPTPGFDFCGTVVAAGPTAPKDLVGSTVCGAVPVSKVATGTGSLAEYITVPANSVAKKPERLSDAAAAGLGIAGQTAALIMSEAHIQKGERVLLNGASGGVGTMMCQILKARGATVFGICSGRNEEMVKKLGASEVIDYTAHDPVHEYLTKTYANNPFDKIIDCNGSQVLYDNCEPYLKVSGIFLNIVGGASQGVFPWIKGNLVPSILGGTARKYKILPLSPNGKFQREVVDWVNEGLLNEVQIDSEYPIEELLQAYEKLATKRARGKIIVKVS